MRIKINPKSKALNKEKHNGWSFQILKMEKKDSRGKSKRWRKLKLIKLLPLQ